MEDRFLQIVKWNPSYISFLSGVFVSAAINVLTGIATLDKMPAKGTVLLSDFTFLFLTAVLLAVFAIHLEDPHHHWKIYRDTGVREIDLLRRAVGGKKRILQVEGVLTLILGIAGIVLLITTMPSN